ARAVFAPSRLNLLVAVTLAVCAVPFAFGAPWFWLVYLVPVAFVVWVLRVRTTVDAEAVTTRNVLRSRRVPWGDIRSLRLRRPRRIRGSRVAAVLADGGELPLPAVGVRDIPALAAVSGGRVPGLDPRGAPPPVHPPRS
ncbi:MAG TPA: PH domain-containing protein, partial [Pseudonocardia sp.]|nr:PH domain-containing protein [Pseudonocardia sp.]